MASNLSAPVQLPSTPAAYLVPPRSSEHIREAKLTWQGYLVHHGLMGFWGTEIVSERAAYEGICVRLAARGEDKLKAEREIIEQRGYFKCLPGQYACKPSRGFKKSIRMIDNAALRVEENWASRASNNAKHKALKTDDKSRQSPFMYKEVQHWSKDYDKLETLLVFNALPGTRYYLGHDKGDFIFRYLGPAINSERTAHIGVVYRDNFEFCGQVPRSRAEYLARIELLVPQVVCAVASVIAFHSEMHCRFPRDLGRICQLRSDASRKDLGRLLNFWLDIFAAGTQVDARVGRAMLDSVVVGEFAYLMELVLPSHVSKHIKRELEPLVVCIEAAASSRLEDLATGYYKKLEESAFDQLFSGKNADNLLVFEDSYVKDIHAFYDQPQYRTDPSHPSFRYTPVDVTAALEVARKLRNPSWDSDSNDETANSSSDSELSDPPSGNDDKNDDEDDSPGQLTSSSRREPPKSNQKPITSAENQRTAPEKAQRGTKRPAAPTQTSTHPARRRRRAQSQKNRLNRDL